MSRYRAGFVPSARRLIPQHLLAYRAFVTKSQTYVTVNVKNMYLLCLSAGFFRRLQTQFVCDIRHTRDVYDEYIYMPCLSRIFLVQLLC
jgi:hypothetical protein